MNVLSRLMTKNDPTPSFSSFLLSLCRPVPSPPLLIVVVVVPLSVTWTGSRERGTV